jgi:hypothetical protein
MSRAAMREMLTRLTDRYQWRHLPRTSEALGMHRGVGVHVQEFDGELSFCFFAPGANVGDEILEHFQGFRHAAEAGLPIEWFKGRVEDDNSCVLHIDAERLNQIDQDLFFRIPDVVAQDFHAHGAAEELPCSECAAQPARAIAVVGNAFSCLCGPCWDELQSQAPAGKLKTAQEIHWRKVWPLLGIATVAGTLIWGYLQQPHLKSSPWWLLFFPFVYAFVLFDLVRRTGSGVNRALRGCLFASVIVVVLAGNVWGFRTALAQQQPGIGLGEAIRLYFTLWLPDHLKEEMPFLIGGILGAGFALTWLREKEKVAVR